MFCPVEDPGTEVWELKNINERVKSHLDDKEERRRRVKGPVVQCDDGGAAGAKQVSHLHRKKQKWSEQINVAQFVFVFRADFLRWPWPVGLLVGVFNSESDKVRFYSLHQKDSDLGQERTLHSGTFRFYRQALKVSVIQKMPHNSLWSWTVCPESKVFIKACCRSRLQVSSCQNGKFASYHKSVYLPVDM